MNRMMKDKLVYSKLIYQYPFQELKKEVENSKKEDESKSISNVVTKNFKGHDEKKRPDQLTFYSWR